MENQTMVKKYLNRCTGNNCPKCETPLLIKDVIRTPLKGLMECTGSRSKHFYGGNVKRFSLTECPTCKSEILLYLKSVREAWIIHDVGIEEGVLTGPTAEVHTKYIADSTPVDTRDANKLQEALKKDNPLEIANEDLDKNHRIDLIIGVETLDLDKALGGLNGLAFGKVSKTLIEAGFSEEQVFTDKGKLRPKAYYVKLVTDYIHDVQRR